MTSFNVVDKRKIDKTPQDDNLTLYADAMGGYRAGSALYNGDLRTALVGAIMGPTTYGRLLRVISATFDPETNTTRAQFEFPPEDADE